MTERACLQDEMASGLPWLGAKLSVSCLCEEPVLGPVSYSFVYCTSGCAPGLRTYMPGTTRKMSSVHSANPLTIDFFKALEICDRHAQEAYIYGIRMVSHSFKNVTGASSCRVVFRKPRLLCTPSATDRQTLAVHRRAKVKVSKT